MFLLLLHDLSILGYVTIFISLRKVYGGKYCHIYSISSVREMQLHDMRKIKRIEKVRETTNKSRKKNGTWIKAWCEKMPKKRQVILDKKRKKKTRCNVMRCNKPLKMSNKIQNRWIALLKTTAVVCALFLEMRHRRFGMIYCPYQHAGIIYCFFDVITCNLSTNSNWSVDMNEQNRSNVT